MEYGNLDANWKPPKGMLPVLIYRNKAEKGKPCVGYAKLKIDEQDLTFVVGVNHETTPKLPLKAHGKTWSVGWDIPVLWAVDGDNKCYIGGGHGEAMAPCEPATLLNELNFNNDDAEEVARMHLGMKPRLPGWMNAALHSGWTPPPTFNRDIYE